MPKQRADQLLVERGLVESRTRAQALILAGAVFSDGRMVETAGQPLAADAPLEVRGRDCRDDPQGIAALQDKRDENGANVAVPPRPRFSIHNRVRSFAFAFAGLRYLAVSEHNAWLHLAATSLVVTAGVLLKVDRDGWLWLVLAIGWVWSAEAFNTAIERLADRVSPERDPQIGIVKDLAAAGVLISAAAAVIGLLVLGPLALALLGEVRQAR